MTMITQFTELSSRQFLDISTEDMVISFEGSLGTKEAKSVVFQYRISSSSLNF